MRHYFAAALALLVMGVPSVNAQSVVPAESEFAGVRIDGGAILPYGQFHSLPGGGSVRVDPATDLEEEPIWLVEFDSVETGPWEITTFWVDVIQETKQCATCPWQYSGVIDSGVVGMVYGSEMLLDSCAGFSYDNCVDADVYTEECMVHSMCSKSLDCGTYGCISWFFNCSVSGSSESCMCKDRVTPTCPGEPKFVIRRATCNYINQQAPYRRCTVVPMRSTVA
jgi:hypothetical protein